MKNRTLLYLAIVNIAYLKGFSHKTTTLLLLIKSMKNMPMLM